MTETAQPQLDPASPPPNSSPFHQPARDNAGNELPPLNNHTQKPDAPGKLQTAIPAQRTGTIPDSAYHRLPPDQQSKYAMVRKPGDEGGSEWVARDQLAVDSVIKPDAGTVADKVRIGEMEVTEAELQEFFQSKGEAELRKASLPATPGAYEAKLPDNFEMPAGVEFKINESDPLLINARAWAHAKGFDQATFSEMVGIYATAKANETAQLSAAHAAEVAKMGANGTQRVTALETWLRGVVGDKLAGPMRSMMVTADIVKGMETLQGKFSSQGAAPFSQAHRVPQEPAGRVSEAEYSAMTPGQKFDYARSFDQRQFRDAR
jgi:hypothetical protein